MYEDYTSGGGPVYNPLESEDRRLFSWERGVLAALLFFPLVVMQVLTLLLTVVGTVLASQHAFHDYGVFNAPLPVFLVGAALWSALVYLRRALTWLLGGGTRPRHELYGEAYQGPL